MSHQPAPPEVIYIIRHGERPEEPVRKRAAAAHRGVDFHGNQNEHSLLPRGWDHAHIPALASALPLAGGTVIPRTWPEERFDLIWTFTLLSKGEYSFAQIPQMLLSGDTDTIIPAG